MAAYTIEVDDKLLELLELVDCACELVGLIDYSPASTVLKETLVDAQRATQRLLDEQSGVAVLRLKIAEGLA